MQANRTSATWLVGVATSARAQHWASLLALLFVVLPGCVSGSMVLPAENESVAGGGMVEGNVDGVGGSFGGDTSASGGAVSSVGGQVVGTGGEDLGAAGEIVGSGGEVVGVGGEAVGTGGQVAEVGGPRADLVQDA